MSTTTVLLPGEAEHPRPCSLPVSAGPNRVESALFQAFLFSSLTPAQLPSWCAFWSPHAHQILWLYPAGQPTHSSCRPHRLPAHLTLLPNSHSNAPFPGLIFPLPQTGTAGLSSSGAPSDFTRSPRFTSLGHSLRVCLGTEPQAPLS